MRLDKLIYLIHVTFGEDESGYPTGPTETKRETFANEKSVKRSEFYAANQSGLRADVILVIWEAEYRGERIIEHNGKRYEVIRTFNPSPLLLELTCSDLSQRGQSGG